MTLTQGAIDTFEAERLSLWERLLGQPPAVLQGEQLILQALKVVSDQLAQGAVGTSASVAPVPPIGAPGVPIIAPAPLDYNALAESLIAGGIATGATSVQTRDTLSVNPGASGTLTVSVESGFVYLFVGQMSHTIDPHSGAVTLTSTIDTSTAFNALPMNLDLHIGAAFLPPARTNIVDVLTNNSAQVVTLTLDIQAVAVPSDTWGNQVQPVIRQLLAATLGIAPQKGAA